VGTDVYAQSAIVDAKSSGAASGDSSQFIERFQNPPAFLPNLNRNSHGVTRGDFLSLAAENLILLQPLPTEFLSGMNAPQGVGSQLGIRERVRGYS
jgi:hypothetical protein